jgi:hypothetical protein
MSADIIQMIAGIIGGAAIIQMIAGIIGGNAMGVGMQDASLGAIGNTITGAFGGLGGGQLVGALLLLADADVGDGDLDDIGYIIGELIGSGSGGAMLTAVVGVIKTSWPARRRS